MKFIALILLGLIMYAAAQNCTAETSCTGCALLKNGQGQPACWWCSPANSNSVAGCFSLPQNGQCTSGDDNSYQYASLGSCPDNPCQGYESYQCTQCLGNSRCGFCKEASRCELGNSTGPFSQDCNLASWRYSSSDSCATYYPCTQQLDCASCVANKQDRSTSCSWCSGKCDTTTNNANCGNVSITVAGACPATQSSSSILSIAYVALIACFLLFLF